MKYFPKLIIIINLFIIILVIKTPSHAQTSYDMSIILPKNVELIKKSANMITALKIIKQCTDNSFIIEGYPHHIFENNSPFQKMNISKNKVIKSEEIIREIARIYDYSLINQNGMYIFTKKYSSPEDFPEIPTTEFVKFLRNVSILSKRFSTDTTQSKGIDKQYQQFAKSLAPEEMRMLNFGESKISSEALRELPKIGHLFKPVPGEIHVKTMEEFAKIQAKMLRFSSLKPTQQSFFRSMAFAEFVGKPRSEIGRGLSLIQELNISETDFHWENNGIFSSFMCCRKISEDRRYLTAWSPGNRCAWNFASTMTMQSALDYPDPDEPKPSDYDKEGKPLPRKLEKGSSLTLVELANQLNQNKKINIEFSVDPVLSSKRITFLSSEKTSPEAIWNAVCKIYNLSLESDGDKLTITFPKIKPVRTWEECSLQIERIFPGSLWRFCLAARENVARKDIEATRKKLIDTGYDNAKTMPISRDDSQDILIGIDNLRRRMIAWLRIQLEPRAKAAKDQKLPWADLTDEEKQWTEFVFACEAIPFAFKLANSGLPEYIKNPQNCIVSGRVYETQGRRFLRLAIRTPDGRESASSTAMIGKLK